MVVAVRTEEADGGLVVVKEARSDGDVARLSREARSLARCRHPGVVELVAVGERSITLRHAGTALARLGPFPTDQAAGIVCAVADVVQALHRLGVVHGDLDASHVLLDDRGRPRLCGFGLAADHTPEGAADDVAALGRLLARLLDGGAELGWARPPAGLRRRSEQRQARRDLEAIAAQATREQRGQRPSARQLAKAVHAAVPGCTLPVPGAPARADDARPAFAEIPADIDPTADLGWTAEDLTWLASSTSEAGTEADTEADPDGHDLPRRADDTGPYESLRSLQALSLADEPVERARIDADPPPPDQPATAPAIPLRSPDTAERGRRRLPLAWAATLVVILVLGVVGGVAGARAVRPLDDDVTPPPAGGSDDAEQGAEASGNAPADEDTDAAEPTSTTTAEPAAPWPASCEVPSPAGPDVDGDGCPEPIALDGRTATVGSVRVVLGQEGDIIALADWDCDGTATPALLRPGSGEVFVFPRWSLDEPLEVGASTVVPGATAISAGAGDCPDLVVHTADGARTVPA